jgi:hypothetical protein
MLKCKRKGRKRLLLILKYIEISESDFPFKKRGVINEVWYAYSKLKKANICKVTPGN